MKTSTIIRVIFLIVGISLVSHLTTFVVEHFININVLFYTALILTFYVAYKGIKADFKKKHHNKEKNNAY